MQEMFTLLWILSLGIFRVVTTQTLSVIAVSNNTGTIPSNTVTNTRCSRGISYQELSNLERAYFMATQGNLATSVYSQQSLFALNGTLLAKLDDRSINTVVEAVALTNSMIAYVGAQSGLSTLRISVSGGLYSVMKLSDQPWIGYAMAMFVESSSTYVYLIRDMPSTDANSNCKFSKWTPGDSTLSACQLSICSNPPSFYFINDQPMVYGACNGNITFLSKIDGSIQKSLTTTNAAYSHISDPGNPWIIYAASHQATPECFSKLDTSVSGSTANQLKPPLQASTGENLRNQLMAFRRFSYLAVFVTSSTSGGFLRLIDRISFNWVAPKIYNETYFLFFQSQANFPGFEAIERKRLYFGLQASDPGWNFQSFFIKIDLCTAAGNNSCDKCPLGNYSSALGTSLDNPAECFSYGYGKIPITATKSQIELGKCTDSNCVECAANISNCTKCQSSDNSAIYIFRGSCLTSDQIPPLWGVFPGRQLLQACADPNCFNCSVDYTACSQCKEGNGYGLFNKNCTKCEQAKPIVVPSVIPSQGADHTFEIVSVPALQASSTVFKALKSSGGLNVTLFSANAAVLDTDTLVELEAGPSSLKVKLMFRSKPPQSKFTIVISSVNYTASMSQYSNSSCSIMSPVYGIFELDPPGFTEAEAIAAQQKGALMSSVLNAVSPDQPIGSALQTAAFLFDSTGIFAMFGRATLLISRLAFININFGYVLGNFLEKSRYSKEDSRNFTAMHADGSKGKASRYRLPLSVAQAAYWQVPLYFASWVNLGILKHVWGSGDSPRNTVRLVRYHYYSQRIHFLIFSLCFPEVTWLLPRTIFDSKDLGFLYYALALLLWGLFGYEFLSIAKNLNQPWKLMKVLSEEIGEFKMKLEDPEPVKQQNNQEEDEVEENQPQTKQINYKKTYFNIDHSIHLMANLTAIYKINAQVATSMECRMLIFINWVRLVVLQSLGILANQYSVTLGLSFMIVFELGRIFLTLFAFIKFRHYRTIALFLLELTQGITFIIFIAVCLWIAGSTTSRSVDKSVQEIGMWVVIIGMVSEYLLGLVHAIFTFCLARKTKLQMEELKVERHNLGWIKYRRSVPRKKRVNKQSKPTSTGDIVDDSSMQDMNQPSKPSILPPIRKPTRNGVKSRLRPR